MVSGLIRNQMPSNRLRVRLPCPPLYVLWCLAGRRFSTHQDSTKTKTLVCLGIHEVCPFREPVLGVLGDSSWLN